LLSSSVSNVCPATTGNLSSAIGSAPSGAVIQWFTNNAHTGTAYSTPSTAAAGTYYAFIMIQYWVVIVQPRQE
jgi:hypothetical protein